MDSLNENLDSQKFRLSTSDRRGIWAPLNATVDQKWLWKRCIQCWFCSSQEIDNLSIVVINNYRETCQKDTSTLLTVQAKIGTEYDSYLLYALLDIRLAKKRECFVYFGCSMCSIDSMVVFSNCQQNNNNYFPKRSNKSCASTISTLSKRLFCGGQIVLLTFFPKYMD